MYRSFARGFTLIELMIVVVIVSILATIALPAYNDYVLRAKLQEATSALADASTRMEQYYQDNRRYATVSGGTTCGYVPQATKSFTYSCTAVDDTAATPPQAFTLTATGKPDQGVDGFAYTINDKRDHKSTITKPGWSDGTEKNCWITKKGDSC